ncbi:MAG TPA: DUF1801 domain-containing protein [Thiobacillaceae bacterium]|nr:DUF1801 domain-containing protein [Thiobacillaceae bacterium]
MAGNRKWTPSELSSFSTLHPSLNGIESLCQAQETSLEDARALLERAAQMQKRGITYNNLKTKCRVLRAVLENFAEPDAIRFAERLFGHKGHPTWGVYWDNAAERFEQLIWKRTRSDAMTPSTGNPSSIDEYIASFAPEVQAILQKVRATVRAAAPSATELIRYRMLALKQNGVLVYFAAFKNHIGFYPPVTGDTRLEQAASVYAGEMGNLRFPLDKPIPYELIGALTKLRAKQDVENATAKRRTQQEERSLNKPHGGKNPPPDEPRSAQGLDSAGSVSNRHSSP